MEKEDDTKKWWIFIAIGMFVVGFCAQTLVGPPGAPLLSPANIPLFIYTLVTVYFVISIAIWSKTRAKTTSIDRALNELAKYAGQKCHTVSHLDGYRVVEARTQTARSEILKLIYYDVDQMSGRPLYDHNLLVSAERKSAYDREREKLERERNNDDFRYVEIVQIPHGHTLQTIIPDDPLYKDSCCYISDLSTSRPESFCLRRADVVLPNTCIIIDKSFLYLALQIKSPDPTQYEYPFIGLMVDDPESKAIKELVTLFRRIESNSSRVTRMEA